MTVQQHRFVASVRGDKACSLDGLRRSHDVHTTRLQRRIERMRTQYVGRASRSVYRTSGTPHMARNRMASRDAAIFTMGD